MNPFLTKYPIHSKKVKTTTELLSNSTDDSSITNIELNTIKLSDTGSYVKVFTSLIDKLQELSTQGLLILIYTIGHIGYEKDIIEIPNEVVNSIASYKRGIAELQEHDIIAPAKGVRKYYINPYYLFKGNRIKYLKNEKE